MVLVDVAIAKRVYELAHPQAAHMSDQMCQQRIRADVEGHAQKRVSGTLVKLAMKSTPLFNLKLKQRVARRQVNFITNARVPSTHDQAARIRVRFNPA